MDFVVYNNKIISKKDLNFYNLERFRYADACFESMLYVNGIIPLLKYHQKRLDETADFLDFEPQEISIDVIKKLVEKQEANVKFCRIRYTIVRVEGINYLPKGSKVNVLIECEVVNEIFREIKNVGFYNEMPKCVNLLSSYKTANSLLYVKAKQYALKNNFGEVLLKNTNNFWVEASSSNLFVVKENILYTPTKNSGQVKGVFNQFLQDNFEVKQIDIDSIFLSQVNELFLTNGVQFIQPVLELNYRELDTQITREIINKIKELIKF